MSCRLPASIEKAGNRQPVPETKRPHHHHRHHHAKRMNGNISNQFRLQYPYKWQWISPVLLSPRLLPVPIPAYLLNLLDAHRIGEKKIHTVRVGRVSHFIDPFRLIPLMVRDCQFVRACSWGCTYMCVFERNIQEKSEDSSKTAKKSEEALWWNVVEVVMYVKYVLV